MSLVEMFVRTARKRPNTLAIIDKATGHRVTYKAALLRSLILSGSLKPFDPGLIGVMIPTSAAAMLTVVAAVMSGRTPVMINYSTGAAQNCRLAQRRLGFRTIITSRALLAKINCPEATSTTSRRPPCGCVPAGTTPATWGTRTRTGTCGTWGGSAAS